MNKYLKKKRNNSGFTLVEMVVAFAILAVIMLTVTFVVSTSSNTYRKITTDINLQYESQIAMSQLQEYVIDSNTSIAVSSNGSTLYIFNKTGDITYKAYKFTKKANTDELYFYTKTFDTDSFAPDTPGNFSFDDNTGEPMSSYVESFTADVSASSVLITIRYSTGGKSYTGKQTIALRNQIAAIIL